MTKVQQLSIAKVHGNHVPLVDLTSIRLVWRKIPSYPELKASTWGGIKRVGDKKQLNTFGCKGYNYISYKGESIKIANLVASAFHPNPDNKPIANHKDGLKYNDFAYNLEWSTNAENTSHAINELGYTNNFGREPVDVIKDGAVVFNARSVREAARFVGGKSTHVSQVCKGKRNHHKGYLFKYAA